MKSPSLTAFPPLHQLSIERGFQRESSQSNPTHRLDGIASRQIDALFMLADKTDTFFESLRESKQL
ncbi:MAG: hypothetical protein ACLVJ6_10725 [Merdibacter sp.]